MADVAERLCAQYDGVIPRPTVATVVLDAVGDLDGQVRPTAFAEMLHQLARYRLDCLRSAGR